MFEKIRIESISIIPQILSEDKNISWQYDR
jgi:hypothetical protein